MPHTIARAGTATGSVTLGLGVDFDSVNVGLVDVLRTHLDLGGGLQAQRHDVDLVRVEVLTVVVELCGERGVGLVHFDNGLRAGRFIQLSPAVRDILLVPALSRVIDGVCMRVTRSNGEGKAIKGVIIGDVHHRAISNLRAGDDDAPHEGVVVLNPAFLQDIPGNEGVDTHARLAVRPRHVHDLVAAHGDRHGGLVALLHDLGTQPESTVNVGTIFHVLVERAGQLLSIDGTVSEGSPIGTFEAKPAGQRRKHIGDGHREGVTLLRREVGNSPLARQLHL